MHVALNMIFVGSGLAGGKTYCDGLLQALAQRDAGIDYTVFTRRDTRLPSLPEKNFHPYRSPIGGDSTLKRAFWEYVSLPGAVLDRRCDLLHGLGGLSPAARRLPLVLTIHDLIYLRHPRSIPRGVRWFMRLMGPRAARRAERIIVPSAFTAQDVMDHYGIPEKRLRIVPLGPGAPFRHDLEESAIEEALSKHGIRRPYLLAVSRGYPHKNLLALLQAMPIFRQSSFPDVRLVLAGERHRVEDELNQARLQLNLHSTVLCTGFVDHSTLNALYCGASGFVFPSLAEGFGLPVLEAMACGVPVIASDATAIPEAVGKAGLLVDARHPEALAEAMTRLMREPALRQELRLRGFEQVRQFGWEKCARETVAVYKELCG